MTILKTFNSYFHSDNKIIDFIENKILDIYIDKEFTDVSKTRPKSAETNFQLQILRTSFGLVKSRFQKLTNINCPWIDDKIWNDSELRNGFSYPEEIRSEETVFARKKNLFKLDSRRRRSFKRESERSTWECIKSYSTRERWISSSQRNCIGRAGIKAAEKLGIISRNNGRKDTLKGLHDPLKVCVEDTSKSTNSGFPLFRKKNSTVCMTDTLSWLTKFFENPTLYSILKNPLMEMPTTLFYRVQPSIDEVNNKVNIKIRQVWSIQQRIICLEYYFFKTIVDSV